MISECTEFEVVNFCFDLYKFQAYWCITEYEPYLIFFMNIPVVAGVWIFEITNYVPGNLFVSMEQRGILYNITSK